jgi:non-specific serine/threonine protein kinase
LPIELTRDDSIKNRFIHEAQNASSLDHPNICTIFEINESDDGQIFISMPCYEGITLKEKILQSPLPLDEVINISVQIGDGLNEAHQRGIIHRDIKPANIMITARNEVKILDFGLSKLSGQTKITKKGSTIGTVAYMSPEQARGEEMDYRSDIWSLGIVMYEMIVGQLPFKGEYEQAIYYSIMNDDPEPITALRSGVPIELERIILKAISRKVDERYQHIDELLTDLKRTRKLLLSEKKYKVLSVSHDENKLKKFQNKIHPLTQAGFLFFLFVMIIGVIWSITRTEKELLVPYKSKSIAVLPFESITKSEDEYSFSNGIHDDIINQLAKIKDLKVIARTSVLGYRGTDKRIRDIAKELGVQAILEGSVRRAGDKVRVVTQLVDGKSEDHIWAEKYDRDYKDIFAIQSDIAVKISNALKSSLTINETHLISQKPTESMEAYDLFLQGNYWWYNAKNLDEMDKAIHNYEKAIYLDPDFGLAYARLAIACFHLTYGFYGFYNKKIDYNDKGKWALHEAEQLIPEHPIKYLAESLHSKFNEKNMEKAVLLCKRGHRLAPNNVEIIEEMGNLLLTMRFMKEALEYFKIQYELDPFSLFTYQRIGQTYACLRNWKEAEVWQKKHLQYNPTIDGYATLATIYAWGYGNVDKALEVLDEAEAKGKLHAFVKWEMLISKRQYIAAYRLLRNTPYYEHRRSFLALTLEFMGEQEKSTLQYDSAKVYLENLINTSGEHQKAFLYSWLGRVYAALGQKQKAINLGKLAMEMKPIKSDPFFYGEQILAGYVYILIRIGQPEEACKHLDTLLSIPSLTTVWQLKLNPRFDPIRNETCFVRLLQKYDN